MQSDVDEWLALEEELALERGRTSVLGFTTYTMPDYEVNWHHRLVASYLDRVVSGDIKRLIIAMPPRHGKSELVSVRFPAYLFGRFPKTQIIAASYNVTLASKMNRAVQRVMDHPSYRRLFPESSLNEGNVRTVHGSWLRNSDEFEIVGHGGFYRSAGVGSSATGYGMTLGIIDDPVKSRLEADSPTYRDRVWDWYTSTFYSRLEKGGSIVLCATRWHSDDLTARLLNQSKADAGADKWTVLSLPAYREDFEDPEDPRAELGEPMWPTKYDKQRMEQMRHTMGSRDWASLYMQRPAPAEGGIVKASWWQFYDRLPEHLTNWLISVDLAFKGKKGASDYCCFQVWACKGANRYLVDQVMDRLEFTEQLRAFKALCAKWPQCRVKVVEDAANGAALVSLLKREIQGIIPVRAVGSKESRLEAVAPQIEAGNVWLPRPQAKPWVEEVMAQVQYLGSMAHDDAADAMSQGLMRLRPRSVAMLDGLPQSIGTCRPLGDVSPGRF